MKLKHRLLNRLLLLSLIISSLTASDFKPEQFELPLSVGHITVKPHGSGWFMSTYSSKATQGEEGLAVFDYMPDGKSVIVTDDGNYSGRAIEAGTVSRFHLQDEQKLWSVKPFKPTLYGGNYATIENLQISRKGRYIALSSSDSRPGAPNKFIILNAKDGSTYRSYSIASFLPRCAGTVHGKTMMLHPRQFVFSNDEKYLYVFMNNSRNVNYGNCTVVNDRWLMKYDIEADKMLFKQQITMPPRPQWQIPEDSCMLPFQYIGLNHSNDLVAVSDCSGVIRTHDAITGKEVNVFSYLPVYRKLGKPGFWSIDSFTFHPQQPDIFYAVIGDSGSKSVIARADLRKGFFYEKLVTAVDNSQVSLEFSPDGRFMAAGTTNLYLWDLKTRKLMYSTFNNAGDVSRVKFNPQKIELAMPIGEELLFFQHRPVRDVFKASSAIHKPTGLFVKRHAAIYAISKPGEFYTAWDNRKIDAYSFNELDYWGNTEPFSIKDVAQLRIKPEFKDDTVEVRIYGGLTRDELSVSYLRQNLKPWSQYHYSEDDNFTGDIIDVDYENNDERFNKLKANVVEYGNNIKNDYCSKTWPVRKKSWQSDVKRAKTAPAIATLVKELESNIQWAAVTQRWRDKRKLWLRDVRKAKHDVHIAILIMNFDDFIYSKAFDATFYRKRHKKNLEELEQVREYGERELARQRDKEKEKIVIEKGKENEELSYGINTENLPLIKAALEAGADIEFKNELENTPLKRAVLLRNIKLTKFLIEEGADVNTVNFYNSTPLHSAAYLDQTEIARLLLNAGAKIDQRDNGMSTPLMTAAKSCRLAMVKILLKRGANKDLKNKENETAYEQASSHCMYNVTKQMKEAGL